MPNYWTLGAPNPKKWGVCIASMSFVSSRFGIWGHFLGDHKFGIIAWWPLGEQVTWSHAIALAICIWESREADRAESQIEQTSEPQSVKESDDSGSSNCNSCLVLLPCLNAVYTVYARLGTWQAYCIRTVASFAVWVPSTVLGREKERTGLHIATRTYLNSQIWLKMEPLVFFVQKHM